MTSQVGQTIQRTEGRIKAIPDLKSLQPHCLTRDREEVGRAGKAGKGREGSTLVSGIILPVQGEREGRGDTGFLRDGKHYLVQFHTLGVPLPTKIKPVGVLPWRQKDKAATLRFLSSLTFSQTSKRK